MVSATLLTFYWLTPHNDFYKHQPLAHNWVLDSGIHLLFRKLWGCQQPVNRILNKKKIHQSVLQKNILYSNLLPTLLYQALQYMYTEYKLITLLSTEYFKKISLSFIQYKTYNCVNRCCEHRGWKLMTFSVTIHEEGTVHLWNAWLPYETEIIALVFIRSQPFEKAFLRSYFLSALLRKVFYSQEPVIRWTSEEE